jgi:hypothetical protein
MSNQMEDKDQDPFTPNRKLLRSPIQAGEGNHNRDTTPEPLQERIEDHGEDSHHEERNPEGPIGEEEVEELNCNDMEETSDCLRTIFEIERMIGNLTKNKRPVSSEQARTFKGLTKVLVDSYMKMHNSYIKLMGKYEECSTIYKKQEQRINKIEKTIEEECRSLKEEINKNLSKPEDMKCDDNIGSRQQLLTYAQSVGNTSKQTLNGKVTDRVTNRSRKTLLIYPENDKTTSEELRDALYKTVDPRAHSLKIHRLSKIRQGGVAVELESDDCDGKIPDLFKKVGIVREPKKKLPKMIIYDIPSTYTEEELKEDIYRQNFAKQGVTPEEYANEFKLLFRTGPTQQNEVQWVVEISGRLRNILKDRRVFIDWRSCKIQDYVIVVRCFRCQLYGHMSKDCQQEKEFCGHCAEQGHSYRDCKNTSKTAQCINCKRAKQPHSHPINSKECSVYIREKQKFLNTISYE